MRKWLKDLRNEKTLSQQAVAEKLGVSRAYYSRIEKGSRKKDLALSLIRSFSEIFDVPESRIIEEETKTIN